MATSAEDMGECLVDSSFDDKSDEELSRQQQTMSFYEEALKNESFQKRRELREQSKELLDISVRKFHIAQRRKALLSVKADPADFELINKKLTEWIALSEQEAIDDAIATKWENVMEGYELSIARCSGIRSAAEEGSVINPIVRHYGLLKRFSPMLNIYKSKVEEVKPMNNALRTRKRTM